MLSLVSYRSSAIVDLDAVEAAARSAGAHVVWDLSHAAGAIPVDLAARDVGLAVGCTYKYLFGGPGAPAFLYVHPRLQDRLRPPVQGWFAQRDQFAMGPSFERRPGIEGWLAGTPPILALTAVEAGVEVVAEAGIEAIRAKSVALTAYAVERLDADLAPLGCTLGSPRDPARRGSHVAIRHPDARAVVDRLMARGVVTDFREPDVIRFGLSPLTTSFADVDQGGGAAGAARRRLVGGRRRKANAPCATRTAGRAPTAHLTTTSRRAGRNAHFASGARMGPHVCPARRFCAHGAHRRSVASRRRQGRAPAARRRAMCAP